MQLVFVLPVMGLLIISVGVAIIMVLIICPVRTLFRKMRTEFIELFSYTMRHRLYTVKGSSRKGTAG